MDTKESIESALATLEQANLSADVPPAVIRLAPDSNWLLLGNREGYVQLAIASLKAAGGNDQSFEGVPWVGTEELDWGLSGLHYDANAHALLRQPRVRRVWLRDKVLLLLTALLVLTAMLGLSMAGVWITHCVSRLKH